MEMQVNFLSKLVSLRPGSTVQKMISDVMHGKNEGADNVGSGDEDPNSEQNTLGGIAGRVRSTALLYNHNLNLLCCQSIFGLLGPGWNLFRERIWNYSSTFRMGNCLIHLGSLQKVHQKTLQILQEMAF
ncbi:hypothetical protein BHE74_00035624 [Ensete ventricosum]|nr:hypothetical protein GW17_00048991 [Ensete ventricosum]RWW57579.1 hypothetical protein BHE74_00035624 [Ensete ventricosum]RZS08503.1 hypothetical protein BHM03_00039479 [Ensete ventricosum]